jgi:multidrug efflux system membrane fusion protein
MKKFGCAVIIVGAVAAAWFGWHYISGKSTKARPATPPVPVTAGTVTAKDVPIYIRSLGTVQANYTVTLRSQVDGPITQVYFTQGQEVKAGDPLFLVDPGPYKAALDAAKGTLAKDQAQLAGARVDLARYAKLVGPGYQSRQSYDDEKATVAQLVGTVETDIGQVETAQINLDRTTIRSPIDGRTGARLVDPGNLVQAAAATSLVSITQISPCFVNLTAPQDQFDEIRANNAKGTLKVEAYAGDDKTLLSTGTLSLINNQIDTTTGTIQLKGTFDNKDEKLWPGEFLSAHLILTIEKGALTVPSTAVMEGPNGYYAYVIKDDGTAERTDVEVSEIVGDLAIVSKGLQAGQKIVVDGQYRLTKGAKVKIVEPTPSAQKKQKPPPPQKKS